MNPLFSIVVTVYNKEKYIDRCIKSLTKQSFSDYELIVIDDGSTDNSGIICDDFNNQFNNIHVYHTLNNGVSAARNLGIQKSSGSWLLFVDGDDYVSPYLLDVLSLTVVKNNLLCYSFVNIINKKEYPIILPRSEFPLEFLIKKQPDSYMVDSVLCSVCNKVYETEILKKEGICFKKNVHFGEDFIFNTSYLKYVKEVKCINNLLYYYDNDVYCSGVKKVYKNFDEIINLMSSNLITLLDGLDCNSDDLALFYKSFILKGWHYCVYICIQQMTSVKATQLLKRWFQNMPLDIKDYSIIVDDEYKYLYGKTSFLSIYFVVKKMKFKILLRNIKIFAKKIISWSK